MELLDCHLISAAAIEDRGSLTRLLTSAKLQGDWLAGDPMRQILASQSQIPLVGSWLSNESAVWFFVWGGLIFDIGIVPLLLMRRTRILAYGLCLAFHVINATMAASSPVLRGRSELDRALSYVFVANDVAGQNSRPTLLHHRS
jgi:hypothetical protein